MRTGILFTALLLGTLCLPGTAIAADGAEIVQSMDEARALDSEVSERDKYLMEHYLSEKTHIIRTPDNRYVDTIVELESPPDPPPFTSTDLSAGPIVE